MMRHVLLAVLFAATCTVGKGFFSFFGSGDKNSEKTSEEASNISDSESASYFGTIVSCMLSELCRWWIRVVCS